MAEYLAQPTIEIEECAAARVRFRVQGVVQGVGFRPFVYSLATRLGLSGMIYNDSSGVLIEVEGPCDTIALFHHTLATKPPPLAIIEQITPVAMATIGDEGFAIVESQRDDPVSSGSLTQLRQTLVSPDLSICDDCLRELLDPSDRRYRYPFINCTNCGPRFTIIEKLPYDRPLTTMAEFALCPQCRQEYSAPDNRRFHAQPIACPTCGPQLEFRWSNDQVPQWLAMDFQRSRTPLVGEAALQLAQQVLLRGGIVAIKGIGGFHLACDATNRQAVMRLRQRKERAEKPFAIMARDLTCVKEIADATTAEILLLTSRERPIVLLNKKIDTPLADEIAPANGNLGIMLPYSPLHHLLFVPLEPDAGSNPGSNAAMTMPSWLVMTSGNYADEPIVTDNADALSGLAPLADCFLTHNRTIYMPCDDSVYRMSTQGPMPIRRARGYAPLPIKLPFSVPPILAVGCQLKNSLCLAQDHHAFLSQHIGDMQEEGTLRNYDRIMGHMQQLFRIQPEVIARDMHPGYSSTLWAEEYAEKQDTPLHVIKVQHHHAHIAALMAEHDVPDKMPVIGFCFDGTGYGSDGAIWGGEVLVAEYSHFERAAHLRYFPLPGGDAAIRRPYRTALAALWAAGIEWDERLAPVAVTFDTANPAMGAGFAGNSVRERDLLRRQLEVKLNCVSTSSMGRLFDVVAALAGLRQTVTYEAQAAIELETLVDLNDNRGYHFVLPTNSHPYLDWRPVLKAVVADALENRSPALIATRFHNAVANLIVEYSGVLRAQSGINTVALSGGVFQNMALLRPTLFRLEAAGFKVLAHRLVPPNDGGVALGQAVVAAAQLI